MAVHFLRLLILAAVLLQGCALFRPPLKVWAHRANFIVHEVRQPGETLGAISERYTGRSQNWKTIASANPGINVKRIKVGDQIRIPTKLLKERYRANTKAAGGKQAGRHTVIAPPPTRDDVEILPGSPAPNDYIPEIRDPIAAADAHHEPVYDPAPFVPRFEETAPPPAKPAIDPQRAEEERLKRRYELLMEIMEKESGAAAR